MPCSTWMEWNPVTEKWQIILNEFYKVIYCDKCPCPKCIELDWIKIILIDYDGVGPPATQRVREITLANGIQSDIGVSSVFSLDLYAGTLRIKVTAPDSVCEHEKRIKIEYSWLFNTGDLLQEVDWVGSLCLVGSSPSAPATGSILPYEGETITNYSELSACGCYDFCDLEGQAAYSSTHFFGNIVIEPGPEDALSTVIGFQLFFCYKPCGDNSSSSSSESPTDSALYFIGPDEGGFDNINQQYGLGS